LLSECFPAKHSHILPEELLSFLPDRLAGLLQTALDVLDALACGGVGLLGHTPVWAAVRRRWLCWPAPIVIIIPIWRGLPLDDTILGASTGADVTRCSLSLTDLLSDERCGLGHIIRLLSVALCCGLSKSTVSCAHGFISS
jgi:hypothetical protein